MLSRIKAYIKVKQLTNLYEVNIATINICNRKCVYCKFGQTRKWKKLRMEAKMFRKIISDLKKINYQNLIGLFVNNEPLLDKRIFYFLKVTKKTLLHAKTYLFSNGDLLDEKNIKKLFRSGLDKLFISLHDDSRLKEVETIVGKLKKNKVIIKKEYEINKQKYFHNRGGSITARTVSQKRHLNKGCLLPFRQMVINPEGNVYLCCCDFYYDVVFGNAKDMSVVDTFYKNPKLNRIRKQLILNNRKGLKLCEQCSFSGSQDKLVV